MIRHARECHEHPCGQFPFAATMSYVYVPLVIHKNILVEALTSRFTRGPRQPTLNLGKSPRRGPAGASAGSAAGILVISWLASVGPSFLALANLLQEGLGV